MELQPLEPVTITEYVPVQRLEIDCKVWPLDHSYTKGALSPVAFAVAEPSQNEKQEAFVDEDIKTVGAWIFAITQTVSVLTHPLAGSDVVRT